MNARVGLYFGALQLAFALSWVTYVIYLPSLAAQAGLGARAVGWILMLDQLVFIACDLAAGLASDRVARGLGRLGRIAAGVTMLSCIAFVLLPWLAPQGAPVLLALTLLWAASSSALRAPPLALLGRHVPRPAQPGMLALSMLGLGLANAAAPWLGLALKGVDPRGPFVLASGVLVLVTLGLARAETTLARRSGTPAPAAPRRAGSGGWPAFAACALLAALGFQVQSFVNSTPLYLRHAAPAELPWLAPTVWAGFSLGLWPASLAARRWGALPTLAAGAVLAALCALLAERAGALAPLVGLQLLTGVAWAGLLNAAFAAALALGQGGREGLFSGTLSALLAAAALARLALVALGISAPLALWPTLLWGSAALLAGLLSLRMARPGSAA